MLKSYTAGHYLLFHQHVIIKAIAIQLKEAGILIYAKNVHNIFQKATRLALGEKSHTEALLQHMKEQYVYDHGCSV